MDWTLTSLIKFITSLIGSVIPLAIAFCLLFFLWGLFEILSNTDNADKRKEGRTKLVWGLLALFVVVSLAGIVEILSNTILGT